MKYLLFTTLMFLLLATNVYAAGTVASLGCSDVYTNATYKVVKCSATVTSDGSGVATATAISNVSGYLQKVVLEETTTPTTGTSDIFVIDSDGADIMGGATTNVTTGGTYDIQYAPMCDCCGCTPPIESNISLAGSGMGDSKVFTVHLYIEQPSPR